MTAPSSSTTATTPSTNLTTAKHHTPESLRVLVTGGTSGLGLSIAQGFAKLGHRLSLCSLEPEEKVVDALATVKKAFDERLLNGHSAKTAPKKDSETLVYVSADLTKPDDCKKVVERTRQQLGGVDVVINNAGIQFVAPIQDFPLDRWQTLLNIHLTAPFLLIKDTLPLMRQQGWGRIINIASAHGLVASANKSAYVAAKHGLVGLTKTVALETANEPITCNAICPGWVETPLVTKQIEAMAQKNNISIAQASHDLLSEKHPFGGVC